MLPCLRPGRSTIDRYSGENPVGFHDDAGRRNTVVAFARFVVDVIGGFALEESTLPVVAW